MAIFQKNKAKENPSKTAGAQAPVVPKSETAKLPSTQNWLPINDIRNSVVHRKDNHIVSVIRVQPVNIKLLSEKEKMRKVKRLEEALTGIDYKFQIMSIAKPVDLDAFIAKMEYERANTEKVLKKKLLGIYSRQAAAKATSGEALERQFYFLIDQPIGKKPQLDEQVVLQRATHLASSLSSAELLSAVCADAELRTLQFIFTNPAHAAFERAPTDSIFLPPMFEYNVGQFAEEIYHE